MKSGILLIGVCVAASLAAACNNHDGSPSSSTSSTTPPTTPPPTSSMALDTAQVLALAQQTSETSSPFAVNDGAFVFIDTSETTSPITVAQ